MKGKGNVQLPVRVLLKTRLQCSVEKQFSLGSYLWQEEIFGELNQIKSYPFMLNKTNRKYIYTNVDAGHRNILSPSLGNPVLFQASSRCHCGSWMGCSFPSVDLFHLNFNIKKMSPWCSLLLGIASVTVFILKHPCTFFLQSRVSGSSRCGEPVWSPLSPINNAG